MVFASAAVVRCVARRLDAKAEYVGGAARVPALRERPANRSSAAQPRSAAGMAGAANVVRVAHDLAVGPHELVVGCRRAHTLVLHPGIAADLRPGRQTGMGPGVDSGGGRQGGGGEGDTWRGGDREWEK